MLLFDMWRKKLSLKELLTPLRIHNAIIGCLSFGFIAAGVSAQFAESANTTLIVIAGICGGLAGKCIAI